MSIYPEETDTQSLEVDAPAPGAQAEAPPTENVDYHPFTAYRDFGINTNQLPPCPPYQSFQGDGHNTYRPVVFSQATPLPSYDGKQDIAQWLLVYELSADANGWNDTI